MKSFLNRTLSIAWLTALLCSLPALASPKLPRGVHAITGVDLNLPQEDLKALGRMTRDANIVGLGESVHYSGGLFEAKARVVRYLVEKEGFRLFLWESPLTWSREASEYVRSCRGSSRQAMYSIFAWVWWDSSIQELLEWLCQYNQAHPEDPVVFAGMDSQVSRIRSEWFAGFDDAMTLTEKYLLATAPVRAEKLYSPIARECYDPFHSKIDQFTKARLDACRAAVNRVVRDFAVHRRDYVRASSVQALEKARLTLVAFAHHQKMLYFRGLYRKTQDKADQRTSMEARDVGAALVVQGLRELHGNPRTIVWAHDWHLAQDSTTWKSPDEVFKARSLGYWLAREHGRRYFPISFVAYEVGFGPEWGDDSTIEDAPIHDSAIEFQLKRLGYDFLLVNNRATDLWKPGMRYDLYTNVGRSSYVPAENFGATFYMNQSRRADLPWRKD